MGYRHLLIIFLLFVSSITYGQIISGTLTVCDGSSTALTGTPAGGTWSSSNPAIAVVSGFGVVTGVSAGVVSITYTESSSSVYVAVTVNPLPSPISGSFAICVGTTSLLTCSPSGGTWSSSSPAIGSVDGSGNVAGLSTGYATISYTLPTGCTRTAATTVNSLPATISGPAAICAGNTVTYTSATAGGVWSSSTVAIATIDAVTGVANGVSAGTTSISYTLSTGCARNKFVTINALPAAISGPSVICPGGSATYTCGTTGGVWSSATSAIALIDATTGVATGVSAGATIITYTLPTSCFKTKAVTVDPVPGAISGSTNICVGSTNTFTTVDAGGTWTSSAPAIATIGSTTGVVIGVSPGVVSFSYTLPSGCLNAITATVNPLPAPITASTFSICAGTGLTLSSATAGGTWASSDAMVASVSPTTGAVSGIAAGTATINYQIMPSGCITFSVITVNAVPAPIGGGTAVCTGSTMPLSDATTGGTWASSNPSVATITSSGTVTGITAGPANITYQVATSCYTIRTITVNPLPAPISGPSNVCSGSFITLSSSPGGLWSSVGTTVSVNPATGVVHGLSAGPGFIIYTMGGSGCQAVTSVSVNPLPAGISGPGLVCVSGTITLSNTVGGGIWVSDATMVASVAGGISPVTTLTGVSAGTATISYITGPSCLTSRVISVNPLPTAGTLSGPSIVCIGSTVTISSTVGGGAWSISPTTVAGLGSGGVVSGISSGTATVTHTVSSGCGSASVTKIVTVSVTPTAITGPTTFCAGVTGSLSDAVPGGIWSSSSTSVATVGSLTGLLATTSPGITTISYTISGSCYVTSTITVNPSPGPITGVTGTTLCVGDLLSLGDTVIGGTWTSSSPDVASVSTIGSADGVVLAHVAGTTTISYSIGSCAVSVTFTVYATPSIGATATADGCGSGYTLLATGGLVSYVWSPGTGLSCTTCTIVTTTPASTITYTVTGTDVHGCTNTATAFVNGNKIYGHITFATTPPPIPDLKVWLISYDAADSSIVSVDSAITCLDGPVPYFSFDTRPAGNYVLRAKVLSSVGGGSGYIPTYCSSNPSWYNASPITHTADAEMQDIHMLYGAMATGSGNISGKLYSGAGAGGEVPEVGVLVYLRDALTNQVLTYTYTNAAGAYSFGGIAFGDYVVYPEEFDYYTTPSTIISLSGLTAVVGDVTFKKHTVLRTIYPFVYTGITTLNQGNKTVSLYPNPAHQRVTIQLADAINGPASIYVSDITGRRVLSVMVDFNKEQETTMNIGSLAPGIYFLSVNGNEINYTGKLVIE